MPELPEVETIRRGLSQVLTGQTITAVDVRVPKLFIGNPKELTGQVVRDVTRRGKIMIWQLDANYLLFHLKMTGQLIYVPENGKMPVTGGHPDNAYESNLPHKHSHVIFEFLNGTMYFNDLRKFGWIKVIKTAEEILPHVANLGPEYNWPEASLEYFKAKLAKRPKTTIKQSLLDQSLIAGVGNIYADEALFCSNVHPRRVSGELKPNEIVRLHKCISEVFETSLAHGGTSSQTYRKHDGSKGNYLEFANVYKREKLPCHVCGTPIQRIKIAGRSSHFCPNCQKI